MQINAEEADRFLSRRTNLKDTLAAIDKDLKPQSVPCPNGEGQLNVDIQRDIRTVHNVAAYLPGETDEYVIIGAHYDHLGLGGQNSLAPDQFGTPHPGADDNASGTAGMLELARYFSSHPKHKRGFLFLAFSGEELGLLGSAYYVNHPELPLEKAAAMINLDMIGRVQDNKVSLERHRHRHEPYSRPIDEIAPKYDLKLDVCRERRKWSQRSHVLQH